MIKNTLIYCLIHFLILTYSFEILDGDHTSSTNELASPNNNITELGKLSKISINDSEKLQESNTINETKCSDIQKNNTNDSMPLFNKYTELVYNISNGHCKLNLDNYSYELTCYYNDTIIDDIIDNIDFDDLFQF